MIELHFRDGARRRSRGGIERQVRRLREGAVVRRSGEAGEEAAGGGLEVTHVGASAVGVGGRNRIAGVDAGRTGKQAEVVRSGVHEERVAVEIAGARPHFREIRVNDGEVRGGKVGLYGVADPENGIGDAIINDGAGRIGFELREDVGEVVDDRAVVNGDGDGGTSAGLRRNAHGAVRDQATADVRRAAEDADGLGVFDHIVPVAEDGVIHVHNGIEGIDAVIVAAGEDAVADLDLLARLLAVEIDAVGIIRPAHVDEPAISGEQRGALYFRTGARTGEEAVAEGEIGVDAVTNLARSAVRLGVVGEVAVFKDEGGSIRADDGSLAGMTFARRKSAARDDRMAVGGRLGVVVPNLTPAPRGSSARDRDGMLLGAFGVDRAVDDQPGTCGTRGDTIDQDQGVRLNGKSVSGSDGDGIGHANDAAPDCVSRREDAADGGNRDARETVDGTVGGEGSQSGGQGQVAGPGEHDKGAAEAIAQDDAIGGKRDACGGGECRIGIPQFAIRLTDGIECLDPYEHGNVGEVARWGDYFQAHRTGGSRGDQGEQWQQGNEYVTKEHLHEGITKPLSTRTIRRSGTTGHTLISAEKCHHSLKTQSVTCGCCCRIHRHDLRKTLPRRRSATDARFQSQPVAFGHRGDQNPASNECWLLNSGIGVS